jgi:molybdopterin converting factor small subunit
MSAPEESLSQSQHQSIRVLFFAQAREVTKLREGSLSLKISNQSELTPLEILQAILEKYPSLQPLQHCIILAHNQTYLDLESPQRLRLQETDELAVIPPISAGEAEAYIYSLLGILGK